MSAVMNGVIVSASRTVCVLFALAPGSLAQTRPHNMRALAEAWALMHPTVWVSCGYAVVYPAGGPPAAVVGVAPKAL